MMFVAKRQWDINLDSEKSEEILAILQDALAFFQDIVNIRVTRGKEKKQCHFYVIN